MMIPNDEALANFVPAAAVKRRGQVLFVMTGRKAYVGCFLDFVTKNDKVICRSSLLILSWSNNLE